MCDTILCDKCGVYEADTDQPTYTNNYDALCTSCAKTDSKIEELDNEISEILSVLEEKPHWFGYALDLKNKQDELNNILNDW